MKILFWNIRGIANKSSMETLFSFYKQILPDVICLAEPMLVPNKIPLSLLRSMNMKLLCFNSKDGCSKIWILCSTSNQDPKVFSNSDQEITLDFGSSQNFYRISFIYASVNMGTRRKLWQRLHNLCPPTTPWLLLGDFNAILGSHERVGGKPPNATSCSDFSMMIDNCNLEEIPTKGSPFTWARLSSRGYMECRLDRALCN